MKGYKNDNDSIRRLCPDDSSRKPEDVKAELLHLRDKITDLIGNDPAKAALILTEWLNAAEKSRNSSPRKKAG